MKKIIMGVIILFFFQLSGFPQTLILVNQSFNKDTAFNPFYSGSIFGLNITGTVSFRSDTSLVRIILVDNLQHKYLVYENYPMISAGQVVSFSNISEETKYLNSVTPVQLLVELIDATCTLDKVETQDQSIPKADSLKFLYLQSIQNSKVQILNQNLQTKGMIWSAGVSATSSLSYAQKKAFFGNKYNSFGFEFYKDGFFEIPYGRTSYANTSNLVKVWDWRNRHRANNPMMADGVTPNPYYNSEPQSSGWITPPRYQAGCWLNNSFLYQDSTSCVNSGGEYRTTGLCWAFASINSIEALTNLYFNQQINPYLSVQDIVSCWFMGIGPGDPRWALDYAISNGYVDNNCFPFQAHYNPPVCSDKCSSPSDIIKITNYNLFNPYHPDDPPPIDTIKQSLIKKGPFPVIQQVGWSHAVSLIGYSVVKEGDTIDYAQGGIIQPGSPYIGMNYWIAKNSALFVGWPNHTGYIYYLNPPYFLSRIITPIISNIHNDTAIHCVDRDGDGYYNWGIGPKPATCPSNAPDQEDCDDTDPALGPYDPNTYECTLLCNDFTYSNTPLEINHDEVWVVDMYKNRNIVIKSGHTLTIRSKIGFISQAKIIVEPDAKLIVDGGTLTGACNSMWQGIEVWGNYDSSQFTINGHCPQGILLIKNNSLIEDAMNIAMWRPDYYRTAGGIIMASNSTFKNNRRSTEFISYHNFNPYSPPPRPHLNNYSYFSHCSFEIDNSYVGPNPFYAHISMWDVEGISIKGCHFSNTKSYSTSIARGYGIYTIDAGYIIDTYCNSPSTPCPPSSVIRSSFHGLFAGISALHESSPNTVYINKADFTDNSYGIRLNAVNNATVVLNTFDIGSNIICPNFTGIGVELNNCTGYTIEQNSFTHSGNTNQGDNYIGIRVIGQPDPSMVTYNQIYNNSSQGITVGNQAEKKNYNQPNSTGLYYICNKNNNNIYDFYVFDYGIAQYQGSYSKPAGNKFSKNANNPYSDFNNQASWTITYKYYNGDPLQFPESVYNVITQGTPNQNLCPDNYGGNGIGIEKLTAEQISALQSEYADNISAYNNIKAMYESLKDGGNTSALSSDINNSTPAQTMQLRDELLGRSPHLSREILVAAANKNDVLPDPILFEILAANPDELRNDSLLNYLKEKTNPLPDYMIELLKAIASDSTYKTTLQSGLSYYYAKSMNAAYALTHDILLDTVKDYTNLRNWLDNQHTLSADYQIIDSWFAEKNTTSALALLDLLPQTYSLDSSAMIEYNYYKDFKTFQAGLIDNNTNMYQLDSTQIAFLDYTASNSKGIAGDEARNILEFAYGVFNINCPPSPASPVKSATFNAAKNLNSIYEPKISVTPNPAESWAVFSYTLLAGVNNSWIKIVDMKNQVIKILPITKVEGQITWDTRDVPAGLYIFTLMNDKYSKSGKVSVFH